MSESVTLEVGQTWVGSDWKKTVVKINPKSVGIRTQSLAPYGSDWTSSVRHEVFLNWIKRTSAALTDERKS